MEISRILAAATSAEDKVKDKINDLPNHDFDSGNVQNIFNVAYALAGLVAVAFIIYGGVLYVTSAGDSGKAAKARSTILWAVVGLAIVIMAAAITYFITSALAGA